MSIDSLVKSVMSKDSVSQLLENSTKSKNPYHYKELVSLITFCLLLVSTLPIFSCSHLLSVPFSLVFLKLLHFLSLFLVQSLAPVIRTRPCPLRLPLTAALSLILRKPTRSVGRTMLGCLLRSQPVLSLGKILDEVLISLLYLFELLLISMLR